MVKYQFLPPHDLKHVDNTPPYFHNAGMETWQKAIQESITRPQDLPEHLRPSKGDNTALAEVIANFPMRINSWYLAKIKEIDDPLWKQAVPNVRELAESPCLEDPLQEERLSPVPCLVHKFPNRVLFLVSSQCAMYCRFCTRKRKVGHPEMVVNQNELDAAFRYIESHREIRDVLISGGDPLLLSDDRLDDILARLSRIDHVKMIRIGSRTPSTLPLRITGRLVEVLKKYHPLYINTHFNHPAEITPEAAEACARLADAGIPLGCQTVLLRGINDSTETIASLMHSLLEMRVRPYYLFQGDITRGTDHFRTSIDTGLSIMHNLSQRLSGMAVPAFTFDLPDGSGKIALTPDAIVKREGSVLFLRNNFGKIVPCPDGSASS